MATPRLKVLDVGLDRLSDIVASLGKPRYRAKQLYAAALKGGQSMGAVTTLSATDRGEFEKQFVLRSSTLQSESISTDGTIKWLVECPKSAPPRPGVEAGRRGEASPSPVAGVGKREEGRAPQQRMEVVYIPELAKAGRRGGRATLCISSQGGCALACSFCHTGSQAFSGSASRADIVEQVLLAKERLAGVNVDRARAGVAALPAVSHIVFMGQGEPLLNWKAVRGAIETLTHPSGLAMAPRRLTVSTAGVAPVMSRLAHDAPGVRLALSLHAPTDALRSKIMGVNATWPLGEVMGACRAFLHARLQQVEGWGGGGNGSGAELGGHDADGDSNGEEEEEEEGSDAAWLARGGGGRPRRGGSRFNGSRRVRLTFEYVLLAGVNDTRVHACELVDLLGRELGRGGATPLSCTRHAHVNLIPFNPWPGAVYAASTLADTAAFQATLLDAGIQTTVRAARGDDVLAACGQLRSEVEGKKFQRRNVM